MNLVAVDPLYVLGGAGCAGLVCLFAVSAVSLGVVLLRRARKGRSDLGRSDKDSDDVA